MVQRVGAANSMTRCLPIVGSNGSSGREGSVVVEGAHVEEWPTLPEGQAPRIVRDSIAGARQRDVDWRQFGAGSCGEVVRAHLHHVVPEIAWNWEPWQSRTCAES